MIPLRACPTIQSTPVPTKDSKGRALVEFFALKCGESFYVEEDDRFYTKTWFFGASGYFDGSWSLFWPTTLVSIPGAIDAEQLQNGKICQIGEDS